MESSVQVPVADIALPASVTSHGDHGNIYNINITVLIGIGYRCLRILHTYNSLYIGNIQGINTIIAMSIAGYSYGTYGRISPHIKVEAPEAGLVYMEELPPTPR